MNPILLIKIKAKVPGKVDDVLFRFSSFSE